MARAKLTYILNDKYGGYGKTAFYEYRGYEYMIHYCNNGSIEHIGREHREQQEIIDAHIANIGKAEVIKPGTFDSDAIWNMYGWN